MLNQDQFNRYAARGYNRIPLVREVLADCETPLSTYLKLAAGPYSYLLESFQGGQKWGRYSIIGLPCRRRLEVRGDHLRVIDSGAPGGGNDGRDGRHDQVVRELRCDNPLDEIRRFQQQHRVPEIAGMPRFSGGLVGFFGYDTVRYIEPHLGNNAVADPIDAPDIVLMVSDEVVVFDNLSGRLYVIVHADPQRDHAWARGVQRLHEVLDALARGLPDRRAPTHPNAHPVDGPASRADDSVTDPDVDPNTDPVTSPIDDPTNDPPNHPTEPTESAITSSFPRAQFEAAVEKCRDYIYEGDVFQVAISQRMSLPFTAAPLDLYRALRTLNPSPYMYYLDLGGFHIAGASPEILVRLEDGEVTVRPIAGTRRRGQDDEQDAALAAELLSDPKELAEHLMLIDLGRNDVGRVARVGTVAVTDKMTIEKYSHVMHIVSNVSGQLDDQLDAIDVLRATFPAGTLSGAPKVRAMEIIEDLEPDKRGIYSGAIGYIGWNGNMDTAIAIRTALIKEHTVHIQVGAGIVADSQPANEWEETMNKGRAVLRAVAMAHAGLHQPLDRYQAQAMDESMDEPQDPPQNPK